MQFHRLRVKEIHAILRYRSHAKKWSTKNRRDHIVGIQLYGAARHDFGDQTFVLSGNHVFFFNQRDDYHVELLEAGEAFSIHFTTTEEIDTDSFCLPIANPAEILSLLHRAELAQRENNELLMLSLLYRLCAEIEKHRERSYVSKDVRMTAAKEYLDVHLCEPDCLPRAIEQSGITSRHFGTLFRTAYDVTPNRYVIMSRIERAKTLLTVGGLSVGEVAELCGFSDVYYFSKVFKKETGEAPSRWKG